MAVLLWVRSDPGGGLIKIGQLKEMIKSIAEEALVFSAAALPFNSQPLNIPQETQAVCLVYKWKKA